MMSRTMMLAVALGGALVLSVPACIQSTTDSSPGLNPQPLPPDDREDEKAGSAQGAPPEASGTSSSGGFDNGGDAGADGDAADTGND